MKKIAPSILFYAIAIPLILTIHSVSPTNLAGPGLDIVVYGISAVATLIFLIRSLVRIKLGDQQSYVEAVVNVIGVILILLLLYREGAAPN